MLLAVDVGNTDTCFGAWKGAKLTHLWRVESRARPADELAALLAELLRIGGYAFDDLEDVVVGSVVPAVTRSLRWMTEKYTGRPAVVIAGDSDHGLAMSVDRPEEVGPDRVLNAIAALAHHKPPLVVVDFGTATTFDVVDKRGAYVGGVIFPGVQTGLAALSAKAARLSAVEIAAPPKVIGANTIHAMQSGLFWGEIGRIEGLLDRVERELGPQKPAVIATGGLARVIAPATPRIVDVREDLTLEGLRLAWERVRGIAAPKIKTKGRRR